jgi:hypothetical protein
MRDSHKEEALSSQLLPSLPHCLVYGRYICPWFRRCVLSAPKTEWGVQAFNITQEKSYFQNNYLIIVNNNKGKVKISLLQAVEAHWVARGQGSHIT